MTDEIARQRHKQTTKTPASRSTSQLCRGLLCLLSKQRSFFCFFVCMYDTLDSPFCRASKSISSDSLCTTVFIVKIQRNDCGALSL